MNEILFDRTEGYERVNNPHGYAEYDATPYLVLEKMILEYPFVEDDCFVDFGSGKGRVICFAAEHGCHNVIGIEYNEGLYLESLENIRNFALMDCINVYNQKAETYIEYENVNKCFFYNPFYLKYFIKVYKNIVQYSKIRNVLFFLYDAAIEYRRFLATQKNVKLETCIRINDICGKLWVYSVNR